MSHERLPGLQAGCLGEGTYTARVVARSTPTSRAKPIGEVPVESGSWGRTVDSVSSAQATMGLDSDCAKLISRITPMLCELELYRDNDLVWCGPILDAQPDEENDLGIINARDLAYWFNLRILRHSMLPGHHAIDKPIGSPDELIDLALIFKGYCEYALGRGMPDFGRFQDGDPPLYTDDFGLALEPTLTGILGKRTVYRHDLKLVMSELDELSQTGIDWTVLNRVMLVGGTEVSDTDGDPIVLPGRLSDEMFQSPPKLRVTSEGMASEVYVRGNGASARAIDDSYLSGMEISRVIDAYSIEDEVSAAAASASYLDRGKAPLLYVEGGGALAPSAPVNIQQLVPGMRVRALFEGGGAVNFVGALRLDSLNVTFDDEDGESVIPTLQPLGSGADARGVGG